MGLRVDEIQLAPGERAEEEAALQAVLASRAFSKAPALRSMFRYLWDHRLEPVNEYAIAVEALKRKPDFDPKSDSTVRVHVARLRQKLRDYYEGEGDCATVRFEIPPGRHCLEVASALPALPDLPAETPIQRREFPRPSVAVVAMILLALATVGLALQNWQFRRQAAAQTHDSLAPFWQGFFAGNHPTRLVIAEPTFFRFDSSPLRVRDLRVNDFPSYNQSGPLKELAARLGPPILSQGYLVMSDSLAAVKLAQYFAAHNQKIEFNVTEDVDLQSFHDHNIIFLGSPANSPHLRQYLETTQFAVAPGQGGVIRRHSTSGQPDRFLNAWESPVRAIRYGIVTVLPGGTPDTRVLLLAGSETDPLATFLTIPSGLDALQKALHDRHSPRYFEAVVRSEVDGPRVLSVALAELRPMGSH